MNGYLIRIPDCYRWMAAGNKKLYIAYVIGYVKRSHPNLKVKQIKGRYAICIKKE